MEYFFALKVDAGPNIEEVTEEGLAEELIIFQSGGGDQALSFRQGRIISIFLASPEV
ncbi:MAG: hypothetical protein GWO44_25040, partial [Thermoplasmata archaeon]|nr:hypothetical protein [Thermoplasmata archaeon]NIY06442.1 hypothetical protein [Thermoplasmata archaeon]